LLVHNNQVYGLTKGQASPTSDLGTITSMQNHGTNSLPFNPLAIALSAGAKFVARGFSGNDKQLVFLIKKAIKYKGLALIDILQPCVSFNKINTHQWYQQRVYDVQEQGHDSSDFSKAMQLAMEWKEKIPTGVLFEEKSLAFHEKIQVLKQQTLISYDFDSKKVQSNI